MRYLLLVVMLLGLWSCTDVRLACLEEADTEAGEAACAEIYDPDDSEYARCVEAGNSWVEGSANQNSCIAPGSEILQDEGPANYSAAIIMVGFFAMVAVALWAVNR